MLVLLSPPDPQPRSPPWWHWPVIISRLLPPDKPIVPGDASPSRVEIALPSRGPLTTPLRSFPSPDVLKHRAALLFIAVDFST